MNTYINTSEELEQEPKQAARTSSTGTEVWVVLSREGNGKLHSKDRKLSKKPEKKEK